MEAAKGQNLQIQRTITFKYWLVAFSVQRFRLYQDVVPMLFVPTALESDPAEIKETINL